MFTIFNYLEYFILNLVLEFLALDELQIQFSMMGLGHILVLFVHQDIFEMVHGHANVLKQNKCFCPIKQS